MQIQLFCGLVLCLALPLQGQASSPFFWKADPRQSHLEILTALGGWETSGQDEIRLTLVDQTDPRPSVDRSLEYWERWEARHREEATALRLRAWELFVGEPGILKSRPDEIIAWTQDRDSEIGPTTAAELSFTGRWLKAYGQARQELEAAEQSRERSFLVWFNGEPLEWNLEVNRERTFLLNLLQGENRLEILDPATGQRTVRTWWYGGRSPRLRVIARELGAEWSSWNLDVLEPGGKLASRVSDYGKSHPAAGTYTLRWNAGVASEWWSLEDARPRQVEVDVILDGGTDKERRWRFQALVLPGTGSVLIGSFDVED
ncbi:MAG: hypothetical protein IPN59_14440 [Holophaga sp.]|nr:hypothetical protein [Holophaga sp.]